MYLIITLCLYYILLNYVFKDPNKEKLYVSIY